MTPIDAISRPDRRSLLFAAGGTALATGVRAEPASTPAASMKAWDAAERIELWPNGPTGLEGFRRGAFEDADPAHIHDVERPALHVFRSVRPNGQGLLVIPGGAYRFVSIDNEGVATADAMNPYGITVFVLTYRLPGEGWPRRSDVPLQDAQRAMRLIRSRAADFGVDPQRLAALGYSAGGHLTATLATDFASQTYDPVDAADALSARPFAAGLIYPVILMEPPFTHSESHAMLLGPAPSKEIEAARNPIRHIGPDTPPLFFAHAMDDDTVPVDNSILMAAAMRQAKRPVEAHFFQEGAHAFGIGWPGTPSGTWPQLFREWLSRLSVAGGRR